MPETSNLLQIVKNVNKLARGVYKKEIYAIIEFCRLTSDVHPKETEHELWPN